MAILDLTTYKEYKGINSTTKDVKLLKLINAANAFIIEYCNRTFVDFYSANATEYYDGTITNVIYPDEFPIVSVVSISISTDAGQNYTLLNEFTDYVVDKTEDRVLSIKDNFVTTQVGVNSLQVIYKGGLSTYPEDIVQAAVGLVEYFDEENYTPRKSLAGASKDSVIIPDKTARLPPHIRRVLEMHRAMRW